MSCIALISLFAMGKKLPSKKKNTHLSDFRQSKAVTGKYESLQERAEKLERLVEIISRGKYQWEATFDAITAPVQIVTADYRIERADVGLASIGGRNITDVVGNRCYEVFAARNTICDGCPLKDAISNDSPKSGELCMPVKGRHFVAHAYP